MNLIGISGSLRKDSFNTGLLRAAGGLMEAGNELRLLDISEIPLFSQDQEGEFTPPPVLAARAAITAADGVLISTPEYNHGMSGVAKNALDWFSRPPGEACLKGKPTVILSASASTIGGARAQVQLREVLSAMGVPLYPSPDYLLASAFKAFDDSGELVDETALRRLQRLMTGFQQWVFGRV